MNEWVKLALGIWGALILVGFGMKAFDVFAGWVREKRRKE